MPPPSQRQSLPAVIDKTPFQRHVESWKDCQACPLCMTRKQVVLARGQIPCDVLFVGEAPGESENVVGLPFVGPAGHLLDRIVKKSLPMLCEVCRAAQIIAPSGDSCKNGHGGAPGVIPRVCFTNIIACIPRDPDNGLKLKDPPPVESILACRPRLEEFIHFCRPRLIVRVGDVAQKWMEPGIRHSVRVPEGVPMVDILHPAYIIRQHATMRGILEHRSSIIIQTAMSQL